MGNSFLLMLAMALLCLAPVPRAAGGAAPRAATGPTSAPATAPAGPKLMPTEHVLMPIRNRHGLPAMAGAVILKGRLAAIGAVGVRKAGGDVKVTREDQFHIGSCTKAMTATLVAVLIDEGKLGWDTTLAEVLPELAGEMDAGYRMATIRHVLTHRAGLVANNLPGRSFGEFFNLGGTDAEQRLAYVRAILKAPPQAQLGQKYLYSNAGYAVAGAVAERVAKQPWQELMRKRLFAPLGMKSAGFGAMGEPGKIDQPLQHVRRDGKSVPIEAGKQSDNPVVIDPAGRVHCSMADWARFIEAHLNGPRGRKCDIALRPQTWQVLHDTPFGGSYAMGWVTADRDWGGGRVLTHAGSNTMNFAVVWMAPKYDYAVLVAANEGGEGAAKACDEAAGALIGAFPPVKPEQRPP